MSKYLADANTLLVIKGKPYRLVREKFVTINEPCRMCDLKELCKQGNGALNFLTLCSVRGGSGAWFFKESWDCVNDHIMSYVETLHATEFLDV